MSNGEIVKTIKVKIAEPTNRKRQILSDLKERFKQAVIFGLKKANPDKTSSRKKIHERMYYQVREEMNLPSYYARDAVSEVVALANKFWGSAKSKHSNKVSWPQVKSQPLVISPQAYKLVKRGNRWVMRLTVAPYKYIWLPLCVPEKYHRQISLCDMFSKITEQNGKWYVHLPFRQSTSTHAVRDGNYFGVDLGIARLATVVGPGTVKFWDGGYVQNKRRRFADYRRRLGRKKRLDLIKRSKNRERRWMRDVNHKLSREIVDLVAGVPGSAIVLENLTGIRRNRGSKKFNRMLNGWAFRQLITFIEYKAEEAGIPVIFVDPRGTSSTCPKCGKEGNRPDQSHFECSCGYEANADFVGALNISRRGLYAYDDGPQASARPEREQVDGKSSSDSSEGISPSPDASFEGQPANRSG